MDPEIIQSYLEEALKDSPSFRVSLDRTAQDAEDLEDWIEAFLKGLKSIVDGQKSKLHSQGLLLETLHSSKRIGLVDLAMVNSLAELLKTMRGVDTRFISHMNKKVLGFGSDFLKSEMHSFKDSVKAYERIREKCDAAWSRFLPGLSKSKDSGVLAEESLVIEDLKKAHLKASVDMALKSKSFKVEASQFLAEIIQMYLRSQKEFHEDISAILRGVKPFVDRWNVRMDHESSEFQLMLPRIEDFKKSLHKEIAESNTNSYSTGWADSHSPVKEGYLLKKYIPKIGSVSWTRRYFILENGRLSYNFILTSGRRKGQVATTASLNVLLCNIRIYKSEERRFCFEIIHPKKKPWVLQAENEAEVQDWMRRLEEAKLQLTSSENPINSPTKTSMMQLDMEDDDGEELTLKEPIFEDHASSTLHATEDDSQFGITSELHKLVPSLPLTEVVLKSLPATMEDLEVPGTLYITQNRIYFHSFVFGCATQIVIFFSEISGISASQRIYASLVNVETNQGELVFRVDPVLEEELVESLQLIWQNRQQDKPETPEEIVKKLNAMKEKVLSKNSEGSNKSGKPVMDEAVIQRLLERDNYNLPADIPVPTTSIVCECVAHLENKTIDTAFPLPAKMLFELLFGTESQGYWKKVDQERGTRDRQELEWSTDTAPIRLVKCMVTVNNPMVKVKETELTATQKKVLQKDHIAYVVEMRSQTLGMPYGDTFALVTRYCITWLSKTSCQLLITCGIDWIKSPGMLKGIIQSNAVKGLQDGLQIEHQILENQVRAGGASGSKVDALKKQKSGARAHWLNLGIFKYQKIVLALLCGILLWFAVLNLISLWRFSSQVSQYALSMNKDRLKVKSWLKEPEYLLSDGSDYKRLFLDSHFYQSNVSDSRLSYAYHNSTKASVYEALKTSHQRAMRRKNRLERQLALVEKIEASSLFAMYENWLLDQASTSSSSS